MVYKLLLHSLKMATIGRNTFSKSFWEIVNGFLDHFKRQFLPFPLQRLLQVLDRLVRLRAGILLQNRPYAIVHHVQVAGVRRPITIVLLPMGVYLDEVGRVLSDPLLGSNGSMEQGAVLVKRPRRLTKVTASPGHYLLL